MAPELQQGHLQLSVYQTGLMYAILKESCAIADSCLADRALMADIHSCLEETFALTQEQKVCSHLSYFYLHNNDSGRPIFVWSLGSCSLIPTVCITPNCMLTLR
jgi:hypothetical protein